MNIIKILITTLLFFPVGLLAGGNMATVVNIDTGARKAVEIGNPHAFDGGYMLETSYGYIEKGIGFSVVTGYKTTLSSSMTTTQSTIPVSSMDTVDSHTITMSDLGSKVFLTIEPGSSKQENLVCTGISGTNWTGCTRGLAFYGESTASVSANRKTHSAGSSVIMSNVHYIFEELADKDSDETIAGDKTFSGQVDFSVDIPTIPTDTPTTDDQIASKKYVDDTVVSGAPDATETTKGISELATRAEMAAGTATGGTSANLVLWADYAGDTSASTQMIPITEADGDIGVDFLPLDEDLTFSGDNSFSGDNNFDDLKIDNNYTHGDTILLEAGEDISGATTPQPVCYYTPSDSTEVEKITQEVGTTYKNSYNDGDYFQQTFTIPSGMSYLTKIELYLARLGAEIGDLTIIVYKKSTGGCYIAGSSMGSDSYTLNTISTGGEYISFDFTPIEVVEGETLAYAMVFPGNADNSNYTKIYYDSGNLYAGGVFYRYYSCDTTLGDARFKISGYSQEDTSIYICDGNDQNKLDYIGMAISDAAAGNDVLIQTDGIISGFSGLTVGNNIYVQDDKSLGNSQGTYEIKIGRVSDANEIKMSDMSWQYLGEDVFSPSISYYDSSNNSLQNKETIPINTKYIVIKTNVASDYSDGYFSSQAILDVNNNTSIVLATPTINSSITPVFEVVFSISGRVLSASAEDFTTAHTNSRLGYTFKYYK